MRFTLLILIGFFSIPLWGDELTVDPPQVWPADCIPCGRCAFPEDWCDSWDPNLCIDLRNPIYDKGVLSTFEGGVLWGSNIRIQAQKIEYIRKLEDPLPQHSVYCEGNILVDYKGHTLVGNSFFFDFCTQTGFLLCGKTSAPPWYVEGEKICLTADGTLIIENGSITTSEAGERDVEFFFLHTF